MIHWLSMNVKSCSDLRQVKTYALLLEGEVRTLNRRLTELANENAKLKGQQQANLQLEVQLLNEQLAQREKKLFGESSERRPRPEDDAQPAKKRKRRSRSGPSPQPDLPIVEDIKPFDDADRVCPHCGDELRDWKDQYESSEYIDVIQRRYIIKRQLRQKVRCSCGHIETAEGAPKLVPGGRYSPAVAIDVAVSKYSDHLPLNRQVGQMKRQGLRITSQTLWDQLDALARLMRRNYEALMAHVLAAVVIGIDETRWRVFGPGAKILDKNWWVWGVIGNGAVFYKLRPSRATEAAAAILGDFAGVIMADGYEVYPAYVHALTALTRDGPLPILVNCWSHVRRKFVEAEPNYAAASEALRLIGELYAVERDVDQAQVPDDQARLELRARLRKERSAPILVELRKWMLEIKAKTLPRGALGKAIHYADDRWKRLTRFLDDPRVPLDNNAMERAFRCVALGRKNHHGSQSLRGTEVAAIFYSLLESARIAGVNPVDYLTEAVSRALANPDDTFLPHQMAERAKAE